jgi:hypothetical protein
VNPGKGGPFGGNAISGCSNGGGGGALGGAIFSLAGTVTVKNSTFTNNFVTRGEGGNFGKPGAADNGADAGAAVFAVNGNLTILNSTISANQGTGSSAGLTFYTFDFCNSSGCIGASNFFTLDNTIISNNGARECSILGNPDDNLSLTVAGAGNLIGDNDSQGPCPGVATTNDPQLQPLQLNSPGNTPTLAILGASSAADVADSSTSLPNDQRGVTRPQGNGFDIGAYEARPANFSFSTIPPAPVDVGGSGTTTVTVNSFEYFNSPVTLSVATPPSGVSVSFGPNPVTPAPNGSASATLLITLAPTVTPGSYMPTITGTSAALVHSAQGSIVVSATSASISNVIDDFAAIGAIDNSGIRQALTGKLSDAQSYIDAGNKQSAISVLNAMINQLSAQSGKHITASAASVLITDTQALRTSLSH